MAKHDAKGRSKGSGKHIRLYWWLLDSDAYRSLSPAARALLIEFYSLYNGMNNGQLFLSVREAAKRSGVGKDRASKALDELQERGFVKINQIGSFDRKIRHATSWTLTEFECAGRRPTKDFMGWKPGMNLKPGPHRKDRQSPSQGPKPSKAAAEEPSTVPATRTVLPFPIKSRSSSQAHS